MKPFLAAILGTGVLSVAMPNSAYTASTDVGVSVNVSQNALTIETLNEMTFGSFEITSVNAGGQITIVGSISISVNATDIIHNGGEDGGRFLITGRPRASIAIACSGEALLVHESDPTQTMRVSSISINHAGRGLSPCATQIFQTSIRDDGTRLAGTSGTLIFDSPIPGNYSTANNGGEPITINVVYQ